MNLFVAELWRFRSRRVVWVLLIVVLSAITLGMAIRAATSTYDAAQTFTGVDSDCVERLIARGEFSGDTSPCETVQFADDDRANLRDLHAVLRGFGPVFVLLAITLAASCLGAEFGAASLSTQLLFEPRRIRVWLTKLSAVMVGVAIVVAIITAFLAGTYSLVAATRGTTVGVDATWWADRALDGARIVVACMLGAALGFAITAFARRTVAALGVFVGLFILEPLLYQVTDTFDARLPLWPLLTFVFDPFSEFDFSTENNVGLTSLGDALLPPLVWTIALVALAGWRFRRAEIR